MHVLYVPLVQYADEVFVLSQLLGQGIVAKHDIMNPFLRNKYMCAGTAAGSLGGDPDRTARILNFQGEST